MRKEEQSYPVIEWSASRVTLFDPHARQYHSGANIGEVASYVGGGKEVVVALSRRSSFIRTVRVPDAPKPQVAQILQLQLPGILPIAAQDIAFDFRLTNDMSEAGRLAVVGAVAGETLRTILRDLKASNLQAKAVVPASFGSWLLAQSLNLDNCAVAEHVAEGLAVDVIANGELRYPRIAPFPKDAEAIEEEVCRSFAVARVPCSHIVAAAGLNFATADTMVATRPLETFSTPLLNKLDFNIEPSEALQLKAKKELNGKARQAIICWLGVLCVGSVVATWRSDDAQAARSGAYQEYVRTEGSLTRKLGNIKSELATQSGLQAALTTSFQPAQSITDIISSFSSKVPGSKMWLGGFNLERGKPLMIRGTAMDSNSVNEYDQALSIDRRFRNVQLVFDNNGTIEQKPVQEFSVQAHVVGNLPLPSDSATGGPS